jgi:hypothetical protein
VAVDVTDISVILKERHHPLKRLFFAVVGLSAIVFPAWDLAHGFSALTIATPVFAIIIAGAATVGLSFLYGAIFGDDSLLFADGARIVWRRENLLRSRTEFLNPAEIAAVAVRPVTWDSAADTWCITVCTRDGTEITSGDYPTRASADRLRASFAEKVGLG